MTELRLPRPAKVLSQREASPPRYNHPKDDMQRRIWNMLVRTVSRSGFVPPQARPTIVVSLACGSAIDTPVLNTYFGGGGFGKPVPGGARVFAIDDNPVSIDQARVEFRSDDHLFIRDDITRLRRDALPAQADVVVLRHPQYNLGKDLWAAIFAQGVQLLDKNGLLITTAYTTAEINTTAAILRELGLEIVLMEQNPYTREDFSGDFSFDRHVVIAKPKFKV